MTELHVRPNMVPPAILGGYTGRDIRVIVAESVFIPSYAGTWDSGSRTLFHAVQLATGERASLTDTTSAPWDACRKDRRIPLTPGYVVVVHHHFGARAYLEVYCNAADAAPMLAASVELTEHERIVLRATRQYKSSYMGRDRYAMAKDDHRGELFPTRVAWDHAKESLIGRKLLNKAGAITVEGRNAIGGV